MESNDISTTIEIENTLTKKEQRRRMYYNLNKTREQEKAKAYYQRHKDALTTTIVCECSGRYTKLNKVAHCKTKIHLKWIDKQQ
tara:strand:+ start:218 stop:469 length:252 start_codon:yes stop_codon:yes gene_type:complete